jgi:hypothetical protein
MAKKILMVYRPTGKRQLLEYIDAKECLDSHPDEWDVCEDQEQGEYTPPIKLRRLR